MISIRKVALLFFSLSSFLSAKESDSKFSQGCCSPFDLGGEWIYWEAEQSQMELATQINLDLATGINQLTSITPNFKYASGYRFFAEYNFTRCWSLEGVVTHLNTTCGNRVVLDSGSLLNDGISINTTLYPTYAILNESVLDSCALKWNLDLYYFDLHLAKEIDCLTPLDLEPYFGLRGIMMQQKIDFSGTSLDGVITSVLKENFSGGGIKLGLFGKWRAFCGASLRGDLGSSLLYCRIKTKVAIDDFLFDTTVLGDEIDYKLVPTLDSSLGVEWSPWNSRCTLYVSWENHLFFGTDQLTLTEDGNLTTQGVTLGGEIQF